MTTLIWVLRPVELISTKQYQISTNPHRARALVSASAKFFPSYYRIRQIVDAHKHGAAKNHPKKCLNNAE